MHQRRKSVSFTLIATVVVLNVFIVSLLAYALHAAKQRKEQEVRTTVQNLAVLLDQGVSGLVREIDLSLREIQLHLEQEMKEGAPAPSAATKALVFMHGSWLSDMARIRVTDASGMVLFGHGVTEADRINHADLHQAGAHGFGQLGKDLLVSKLLRGARSGQWVHVFSRRYEGPDGRFAGMVMAAVPASHFQRLMTGLNLGKRGIALMRDDDRALIARYPLLAQAAGQTGQVGGSQEVTDIAASGVAQATFYSSRTADGVNRINAYRKLALMPAFVVVGQGEDDYLAQWSDDVDKAIALSVIFFMVTVSAAWLLWRFFNANERANRRNQVLLQNASDGIHITDLEGTVIEASDAFCRMLGRSRSDIVGMHASQWDGAMSYDSIQDLIRRIRDGQEVSTFETVHRRKDGTTYPVEISSRPLELDGKTVFFNSARDITERKQAAENLRIAATAFDSQVGMMITDENQMVLRVNTAFTDVTGYTVDEIIGRTPNMLSSGQHDSQFYAELWAELSSKGSWQGEIWNRRKSGEVYPQAMSIGAVKDEAGKLTHYVATVIDISLRKSSEEEARTLAFFDPLTHLPNRRLLMERLGHAIKSCAGHKSQGALLFIDLDNFKSVNDTVGHHEGDRLLEQVARILVSCVRDEDTVARVGGDEFVIMIERLGDQTLEAAKHAESLATQILHALHKTFHLGASEHRGSASIGITLFGDDPGESVDEPLKRADLAMYEAKTAGRNKLRFFDPHMQADIHARAELDAAMWVALEQGQFSLYYQPQVSADGRYVGAEALVRWLHPTRGMVSPAQFIPLAEENGLILPLGNWVLETACEQLARWAGRPETANLSMAVNVSARQFREAAFVADVRVILERTGANPRRLKLELTESSLVTEVESLIAKMEALKAVGVGFSLDDFGTGYSSLAYLKRLPLDQLKIDQGFVRDILLDANDAAIAKMVIVLAESLGLTVIAEGVEHEAQRAFLERQGCHTYQGYLFSKPLPLAEFEALLASVSSAKA